MRPPLSLIQTELSSFRDIR